MGYIIVIEGTDGCGKNTQAKLLVERLEGAGRNVKLCSFPQYDSPSSAPVKMYLNGEFGDLNSLDAYQSSVLYAVDRLCTYNKDLKEFYEAGGVIVMDRYVYSNMLHQASKIKNKTEVDSYLDWLEEFEFGYLKLPRADKVLFLDVPVEISQRLKEERAYKSGTTKDVHEEDVNHLRNAYNSGKYVSQKYGWNVISCVDGEELKSIEEISDLIWCTIKDGLPNKKELF